MAITFSTPAILAISAGTALASLATVTFSNANNVSFGASGGVITASVAPSVGSSATVSAGASSETLSRLVFSNSNGLAFGLSSGTITGSYTVPTVTNSSASVSAGTKSETLGGLVFSNSNGLGFGLNNGTITGSYTVPNVPAQTNQTEGLYALGNTTGQSSSSTFDARTLSVSLAGIISGGYSAGALVLSATTPAQTVQTQSNIQGISAGTQLGQTGNIVFSNSNGISFGLSNSSVVTASYTVPSTAGHLSAVNLSAGTTSSNASAFTFSNSNNVSFGLNGAAITASASYSQSTAPAAISAGTTSASSGTLVFSNSNGVSFGMNGNTITATVQPGAAAGIAAVAAGTQSATSGTANFVNSNGISFGMSGSSQLTASYTVPSTAGLLSAVNVSAGTTSNNLSALIFANSNGLTFGLNASTITASYTVPTVPAQLSVGVSTGGNTSGDTGAFTGRLVLAGGNNITLSGSSNGGSYSVTISGPNTVAQTVQTEGRYAIGNTTGQSSSSTFDARTLSISGAGIASIGYSGNALVISVPSGGGGAGTNTLGASNLGNTAGTSGAITGTGLQLVFAGGNNVTLSQSINGSSATITVSVFNQSAQTQSNVQGISAGTQVGRTSDVVFSNSNGLSFGMSNSSVVTASYTVPSTAGLLSAVNVSAGTTSNNLSAFTLSNSNGLSFGLNASVVTGSYTVPSTVGLLSAVNLSAGTTSNNASAFTLSNSNNVSFGLNGSTLTASASFAQSNQSAIKGLGVSNTGNTAGNTGISTGIDWVLAGSNNITLSQSTAGGGPNTLWISGPTVGGAQTGISGVVVSNTTYTSGTISFSNANGISFGSSAGQAITASYTVPSTAGLISAINLSAGTTSNNASVFVLSNSNNVSFGLNGSTVTASASFAAQTNQTVGLFALGNTTQNSSSTLDARSLSLNGLGAATIGYSNGSIQVSVPVQSAQTQSNVQGISAGTQVGRTGDIVFSNANGISFGMSGSNTVTASYTVPIQSVQTIGLYAASNTTGASSSSTFDARTVSFQGAGIASVGFTNGSVVISVPAGGGAGDGVNIIAAGTQTAATTGTVLFSNSNGVSFGMSNSSIVTASVSNQTEGWYAIGNTTQNSSTTIDPRTVSLNGIGAMTVGYSNGSIQLSAPATSSLVGANGISISTAGSTISVLGPTIDFLEPIALANGITGSFLPAIGSIYLQHLVAPMEIAGGRFNLLQSFSGTSAGVFQASSSASFSSATPGSRAVTYSHALTLALYSQGTGTNSTRLETCWSNTWSLGATHSVSLASGGATSLSATNAATMNYVASVGTDGNYTTASISASGTRSSASAAMATSAVSSILSSMMNMISGAVVIPVGNTAALTPGNYWLAQAWSSASTTAGTSANVWPLVNELAISVVSQTQRLFGQTASSSGSQYIPGCGVFSVASASPPSTIAFTDVRTFSNLSVYFNYLVSNA